MIQLRSSLALSAALALSSAAQATVLIDTFSSRGLPEETVHAYDTSSYAKGRQQAASLIQLNSKVKLNALAFAGLNTNGFKPLVGSTQGAVLCVYADAAGRPGPVVAVQKVAAKVTAVYPYPSITDFVDVEYKTDVNLGGALRAGKYWMAILGADNFQLAFDPSDAARDTAAVRTLPGTWKFIGIGAAQVRLEGTAAGLLAAAPKKPASNNVCAP